MLRDRLEQERVLCVDAPPPLALMWSWALLTMLAGIASLILAAVVSTGAAIAGWDLLVVDNRAARSRHVDFVGMTIGNLTLSGWQAWIFLAGLALTGLLRVLLGMLAF